MCVQLLQRSRVRVCVPSRCVLGTVACRNLASAQRCRPESTRPAARANDEIDVARRRRRHDDDVDITSFIALSSNHRASSLARDADILACTTRSHRGGYTPCHRQPLVAPA